MFVYSYPLQTNVSDESSDDDETESEDEQYTESTVSDSDEEEQDIDIDIDIDRKRISYRQWTDDEHDRLRNIVNLQRNPENIDWDKVTNQLNTENKKFAIFNQRSIDAVRQRYHKLERDRKHKKKPNWSSLEISKLIKAVEAEPNQQDINWRNVAKKCKNRTIDAVRMKYKRLMPKKYKAQKRVNCHLVYMLFIYILHVLYVLYILCLMIESITKIIINDIEKSI